MQTYKYYLPTGERLGIFYDDAGTVTVVPCSKKDQFSKRSSKELYQLTSIKYLGKTTFEHMTIPIKHWKFEVVFNCQEQFLEWCNNNYKRMFYKYIAVKGKIVKIEKVKRNTPMRYETIKISYLN